MPVPVFLVTEDANTLQAAQIDDVSTGLFFTWIQFELPDAQSSGSGGVDHGEAALLDRIEAAFNSVAIAFEMNCRLALADRPIQLSSWSLNSITV